MLFEIAIWIIVEVLHNNKVLDCLKNSPYQHLRKCIENSCGEYAY